MNHTKIEGKFYPLQHEEWLHACQELTPKQRDVLYFVRSLDPYGNGLALSIADIARQLSTKHKKVHRSTVSRALKTLNEKGFIDLELITVSVKVKAKGIHCCDQPEETVIVTDLVETTQSSQERDPDATVLSEDNKRDPDATSVISGQQARSLNNTQELEAPLDKASEPSKTIKKIKTLSEGEREKFFEFAMNKVEELPKRPALPNKWIETHFDELYQQFCSQNESTETSQAWEDWQVEIEQRRIKAEQAYREQLAQKQTVATSQTTPVQSNNSPLESPKQATSSGFPQPQTPNSSQTHSKTNRLGTDTFERLIDI